MKNLIKHKHALACYIAARLLRDNTCPFNMKIVFSGMDIPIIKITLSYDYLIFIMGILHRLDDVFILNVPR